MRDQHAGCYWLRCGDKHIDYVQRRSLAGVHLLSLCIDVCIVAWVVCICNAAALPR